MTPIKRPMIAASAVVLLGLGLTACGGGAPTDASKEDYCAAVNAINEPSDDVLKAAEDKDGDKLAEIFGDYADKIEETGTPDDISDDEREGFEILLKQTKDLDADTIEKALEDQKDPTQGDLSEDEQKKVDAYNAYESKTCRDS